MLEYRYKRDLLEAVCCIENKKILFLLLETWKYVGMKGYNFIAKVVMLHKDKLLSFWGHAQFWYESTGEKYDR